MYFIYYKYIILFSFKFIDKIKMKNNKTESENEFDVDIDIDESSELWSFRNKNEDTINNNNKKEPSIIDILTQKVNKTLIDSNKRKRNKLSDTNIKYYEEERKNLDFFKKSVEKELEIFESERKRDLINKNKDINNLMNLNMTLSDINIGKCTFVTKDDLIVNLPNYFLPKTNIDDIGNEFQINLKEIERLIPSDDSVAKLHLEYSKENN